MKDMTELADPHFGYWTGRYGTVFLLGSLGILISTLHLWKWTPTATCTRTVRQHHLLSVAHQCVDWRGEV